MLTDFNSGSIYVLLSNGNGPLEKRLASYIMATGGGSRGVESPLAVTTK